VSAPAYCVSPSNAYHMLPVTVFWLQLSGVGSVFSIDVWAGIVGDCLVGSRVLSLMVTETPCLDFRLHDLPELLEAVPLAVRARVRYMHDGAPVHFRARCSQ
jgi:hypothetical protein